MEVNTDTQIMNVRLENLDYKLSIVFDNNGSNCKQTKI